MLSLFTSSTCPSPTDIGDYVMMESCIDNGHVFDKSCLESYPVRSRPDHSQWRRKQEKKEFPPPLTVLAMTENHRPHMPFVMRRFTTDDGRLVIVEEKVKHHDYFRITRSEGRLVLDLVEIDKRENDEREIDNVNEREINDVDNREIDDMEEREIISGDDCCNVVVRNTKKANDVEERESIIDNDRCNVPTRNDYKSDDVEERECDDLEERENVDGIECCNVAIRSVGKCYDYMRVRSSPCLFNMTMPTVRPVHI